MKFTICRVAISEHLVPSTKVIRQLAEEKATAEDQGAFAQLLGNALTHLHEGSVARYRLRHSEFLAWQPVRDGAEGAGSAG
ncbi:hypothetical protein [Pseudomonas sp.]|uniref:hypothetical protein n=1 Tax=Pseudomonas sp. TaxID=306 RepID=UPI002B988DF7|nr:hypothetical protein [Pseudomonas sp.]HUE91570.1 hypothetical protein [Pseudomonas sp.]